jgi:hypothetical protein
MFHNCCAERALVNSAKISRARFDRSSESAPSVAGQLPNQSPMGTSPQGAPAESTHLRLHRWANAKALPSAHVQKWLTLDEPGRTRLLEVAESLKMRAGQCVAALVLLEEISLRESQTIAEILGRPALLRILNSAGSGPGRARAMLDHLRTLRYPRLVNATRRLTQEVAALKLPPNVKVMLPRDLASDEVKVEIIAHGSAEMEHALMCLMTKSRQLMRLAAMLGGLDGVLPEAE